MSQNDDTTTISLSDYILERLIQLRVKSIFSVPGDFNLTFLDHIEDSKHLQLIGCANELNASYAADGYSRVKQAMSNRQGVHGFAALVTTFGVGELSATAGIAGAFSERIPLLHIVGVPSTELQAGGALLHHTLGSASIPFNVFEDASRGFTAAQAFLKSVDGACEEVDRVIRVALETARPTYLTLPTDLVEAKVSRSRLNTPIRASIVQPDTDLLEFVTKDIARLWNESKHPILIVDACTGRYGVDRLVQQLITVTGIKYVSTPMSKGLLTEDVVSGFAGLYVGEISHPDVKELVESADLTIRVGSLLSDFNSGGFTSRSAVASTIELHSDHTKVQYAHYDISFQAVLPKLIDALSSLPKKTPDAPSHAGLLYKVPEGDDGAMVTQEALWPLFSNFFRENDVLIAETGTSSFGILDVRLPKGSTLVSQVLWGCIGYSVGATLGCSIAALESDVKRRTILFVGDGSMQLGVQELGTMIRTGVHPIIVILNNDGYTIERFIHGEDRAYNSISRWKWQGILDVFNADKVPTKSWLANTRAELTNILADESFAKADRIQLLEIKLDKMDAPRALRAQAKMSAKLNS